MLTKFSKFTNEKQVFNDISWFQESESVVEGNKVAILKDDK